MNLNGNEQCYEPTEGKGDGSAAFQISTVPSLAPLCTSMQKSLLNAMEPFKLVLKRSGRAKKHTIFFSGTMGSELFV